MRILLFALLISIACLVYALLIEAVIDMDSPTTLEFEDDPFKDHPKHCQCYHHN